MSRAKRGGTRARGFLDDGQSCCQIDGKSRNIGDTSKE